MAHLGAISALPLLAFPTKQPRMAQGYFYTV